MDTPTVIIASSQERIRKIAIWGLIFILGVILGLLLNSFFYLFTNQYLFPLSSQNQTKLPEIQNSLSNLPIDPKSSAVKSLSAVYTLSGVVNNIQPVQLEGKDGYQIGLISPTGQLIETKFFVTAKSSNIVSLDKQNKEMPYLISQIKKGDPLKLTYLINLSKPQESQTTKVIVLK